MKMVEYKVKFRYRVTIPKNHHLERHLDMFRYSSDVVVEIVSDNPISFVMEHIINSENMEHLKRSKAFFLKQIIGRWGSFGCTISDLKELKR